MSTKDNRAMPTSQLLAVVEVDAVDRVACQAEGCGHGVYRRIHVVRCEDTQVRVYGSNCFARLFQDLIPDTRPRYGGEGRQLTAEERALLVTNTERLVAQFEAEHEAALQQQRLRAEERQRVEQVVAERAAAVRNETERRRPPTSLELALFEAQAKAIVQQRYDVDPDAPGWRGLVLMVARELMGKA